MSEFDRLEGKIDRLTEATAEIQAEVAALRAQVQTELKSHGGQLGALFDRGHEVSQRVGLIEREYVPQSRCVMSADQNRKEHEEFRSSIVTLRESVTRILAIGGVLYAVITIGVQLGLSALHK